MGPKPCTHDFVVVETIHFYEEEEAELLLPGSKLVNP